jgi:predicted transcriptional regulator
MNPLAKDPLMNSRMYLLSGVTILAILAAPASAEALPKVGTSRPGVALANADDETFDLRAVNGKPLVIVYESKDAAAQNTAFKADLKSLTATSTTFKEGYALTPIADADGYDYWPARGFVKSAIRDESKKIGRTVYIDWTGAARKSLGATHDKSAILIYGKDAKLKFAGEGTLSEADRKLALRVLKCEVRPDACEQP